MTFSQSLNNQETVSNRFTILWDRFLYDYVLKMEKDRLLVIKYEFASDNVVAIGELELTPDENGEGYTLQMIVDDTLVFDADASSEELWFSNIQDGTVFE